MVLFPKAVLALHVFEPRYRLMMEEVLRGDQSIVIALLKPGWEVDYYGTPEVHPIACVGRVTQHQMLPDGHYDIALHGEYKVRIEDFERSNPFRIARVRRLTEDESWGGEATATDQSRQLLHMFRRFNEEHGAALDLADMFGAHMGADAVLNTIAMNLNVDAAAKQRLLELDSTALRYRAVYDFLASASEVQDTIDEARHRFPEDNRQN